MQAEHQNLQGRNDGVVRYVRLNEWAECFGAGNEISG